MIDRLPFPSRLACIAGLVLCLVGCDWKWAKVWQTPKVAPPVVAANPVAITAPQPADAAVREPESSKPPPTEDFAAPEAPATAAPPLPDVEILYADSFADVTGSIRWNRD